MQQLLTHPGLEALAVALLHSLWLFALLITLGHLLAGTLPEARRRYGVYAATLLSLPISFTAIWLFTWSVKAGAWKDAATLGETLGADAALALTGNLEQLNIHLSPRWTSFLAALYLIALTGSTVVSIYRYWQTRRLRTGGYPPEARWRNLYEGLCKEILPGGKVPWRLTTQCAQVLTVGILRPVILFPVGLINHLTPDQVAAILRHELTHIRRNDPLWNAVQELVVTLYFYHPLVHWLVRRFDREREYACDDAVTGTTDKTTYATALVRVANYSLNPKSSFTMAATDQHSFTGRIERLFSTPAPAAPSRRRSYLLAALAMLPLCLLLAYSPNPDRLAWLDASPPATVTAEQYIVGTVTDGATGRPLIGATVVVKGKKLGTITDLEGEYRLQVPAGTHTLDFSYAGYSSGSSEVTVTKDMRLDISMYQNKVSEVRVGKTPVLTDREPTTTVQIRDSGNSSLDFTENNILILVDGKKIDRPGMEQIDPATIESIDVLKNAEKIEALGHGTDYTGAILIKLRK